MRFSITSEMAVTPSAWCTVEGLRAEGKVWESKRERRQWTSGRSGKRVEKGASGRRALESLATNSEGKEGKGLLRNPTDFMASFVRRASFVGSPPVPERVCSLSPMSSCRQRRSRKLARMVEPARPPCWASSLIAMLQLVRKL